MSHSAGAETRGGAGRYAVGLGLLAGCIMATGGLACQQLGWVHMPGCGPGSRCAAALAGSWGSLAGWPVSFIGLAYFVGLAANWVRTFPGRSATAMRWLVRLGAALSVGFLIVMLTTGSFCAIFLVIHGGHLAFWGLIEWNGRQTASSVSALVTVCAAFALVWSLLNVVVAEQERACRERVARIAAAESGPTPVPAATARGRLPASGGPGSAAAGPADQVAGDVGQEVPKASDGVAGVVGGTARADATTRATTAKVGASAADASRTYRVGSADAPLQMVLFFDYQSVLCRRLEPQLRQLVALRPGRVAVVFRQFPLCPACNPFVTVDQHANACRAARAAAAAGILQGAKGFWRMHAWLLAHNGQFTVEQLKAALRTLQFSDPQAFFDVFNGPKTRQAILGDLAEAQVHRVRTVPTIVAKQIKLEGRKAEVSVVRATIAAREKTATGPAADQAVPAGGAEQAALPDGFSRAIVTTALAATIRVADVQDRFMGSGVVVGVRPPLVYALTARHVVAAGGAVHVTLFEGKSVTKAAEPPCVAAVVARCPFADLAVLRFSAVDPVPIPLPVCPPEALGGERRFKALSVGCDQSRPTVRGVTVLDAKRVRIREGAPARLVWVTAEGIAAGRSGGPLVDRRGRVLGIASGTGDGKGYFTVAGAIDRFLEQQGLGWLKEAADIRRPDAETPK